jgi:hypothetical protein
MDNSRRPRRLTTLCAVFLGAGFALAIAPDAYAQGGGAARTDVSTTGDRPSDGERGRDGERRGRGRRRDRDGRGEQGGGEPRRQPAEAAAAPAAATNPQPNPTAFGTAAGGDADRSAGLRKWATAIVEKHDQNDNMMLEANEQADLGRSKAADLNKDGVITIDELIAHSSQPTSPAASSAAAASTTTTVAAPSAGTSSGDDDGDSTGGDERAKKGNGKSYRFRSAKDRQASWRFKDRDANGDGQVSMSEYSRSWTDRTASEFKRYDRDNDGMITADEVR